VVQPGCTTECPIRSASVRGDRAPDQRAGQIELSGRKTPFRVAQVRARVDGIVLERDYKEGADVKAGQRFYQIDPAPYISALNSAKATLEKAQANRTSLNAQVERYKLLVSGNAVSKQDYDNAVSSLGQADADIASGKAAVDTAQINVGYTAFVSPITGRSGISQVTEGAYVQASAATLMTTVTQIDPIYVDVTQSSVEGLRLRRDVASGRLELNGLNHAKVTLLLEDGREYPQVGSLQITDVTVDPTTGTVTVRALFPNPNAVLLPGMFVRARVEEGVNEDAFLVPQVGVTHDPQGHATALVVDHQNKVQQRTLQVAGTQGDQWIVESGLEDADRIIVGGLQKVRPGATVVATEAPPNDELLAVTRNTLQTAQASYDLTRKQFDAGTGAEQSLRQAETVVEQAKANYAAQLRVRAQDENILVLLLGQPLPADLPPSLPLNSQSILADIPPGLPSDLLARRPDIMEAEANLRGANANVGAARAAFFPTISLTGCYGSESVALSSLFGGGSLAWSFVPAITVPIFEGGRLRASLDVATVQKDINVAQYEKAIQTAFQEVANDLAARGTYDDQVAALQRDVVASQRFLDLAQQRFAAGIDSYLNVLTAQTNLYAAQQALVSARMARLTTLVSLYKDMGGGWIEHTGDTPPPPRMSGRSRRTTTRHGISSNRCRSGRDERRAKRAACTRARGAADGSVLFAPCRIPRDLSLSAVALRLAPA
jgi:membrane fusion protein, multidrug efflux system